jgi:hypothetical protein
MKKRIQKGGRIYERMQMYTFNEVGRQGALKDAQAWRERDHWAFVTRGIETTYASYPKTVTGPVWAVYVSVKLKKRR